MSPRLGPPSSSIHSYELTTRSYVIGSDRTG